MKNLPVVLLLTALAIAQSKGNASEPVGRVEGDNTYVNQVLGLRVSLPGGKWHLMEPSKYSQSAPNAESSTDSPCRGPLCGKPAIDEALETDSIPVQSLFLNGYKLQPEYLNRQRYPLKKFAEAMMQGSLAGSDWVPAGDMSHAKIAGHEAYRLLVYDPSKPRKKGFGFVFESNGYVCVLVGTDVTPLQDLLPAVEGMGSDKTSQP
jgi:hypothetical protein